MPLNIILLAMRYFRSLPRYFQVFYTFTEMRSYLSITTFALIAAWWASEVVVASRVGRHEVYTNHFSVHVPGGKDTAHRIAKRHGFV